VLHHMAIDPRMARPSIQRNRGWRAARAPLVAFTDDDCRPEPEWLERLLDGAAGNSGDIVQGATRPDPREADAFRSPHVRTLLVDPPGPFTQTCNILYPRALLDRLGGFDETAVTGEDIDLALRAQAMGARVVGAPEALVYHAIEALTFAEKIRSQDKWQHLAYVVKQHPELRRRCVHRIWWKKEHLHATVALAALVLGRRHRVALLGVLPYLETERWRHGTAKREQLRALKELPSHWLIELAEVATFARGSLRYGTVLL
jgi:GT2 family glycosyltransferase